MPLYAGQILQSRYRIVALLGRGGMGAVYLAEDLRLGSRCAVKEQVPDPNANPQALAQARQQFEIEARVLAQLNHPNLPRVSDYFLDGGNEYLVMEYVEGENLASVLARSGGALPEQVVLAWAGQVLDALDYLHGLRPTPVIHRDIKPANLILTPEGRVKLVDFGLVKLLDPNSPATATAMKGMGTPEYAPLEQYAGAGHTDARSDIFSLGAMLYHLLAGQPPPDVHQRSMTPGVLLPVSRLNPAITPRTEAAIMRGIELQPDRRWQSARNMRAALTGSGPLTVRTVATARVPWPWTAGAVAVILILFAGAFLFLQSRAGQRATPRWAGHGSGPWRANERRDACCSADRRARSSPARLQRSLRKARPRRRPRPQPQLPRRTRPARP